MQSRIELDGKLEEDSWQQATQLFPFYTNDGKQPAAESTRVLLGYDEKALYIGWICMDQDIQATYTKRDSELWNEEVAEFFITPKSLTRYTELQWNPLGTVFDAMINNTIGEDGFSKGIQGEWGWTAQGMESAVWVDGTIQKSDDKDTKWQVEVIVPFKALGVSAPQPGETWRGNFYRYNRTKGKKEEHYSWSPTKTKTFHEPHRFGYLEFGP